MVMDGAGNRKNMEKEFEDYWLKHQKRLILKSPKNLREEYLESTHLDTPMDRVCFVLPIAVGIILQPRLNFESEILSWGVVLLVVVVLFALLQMVKPYLQKKKTTIQALDAIKNFYYERYKKYGLDKIESWS